MALLPMYPGKVNSPVTELVSDIDEVQNTIEVSDGSALPDAPNIAVIGSGEDAETIQYGTKTGNVLSDVVRGFQGVAKAWSAGQKVARNFTAYDYDALRQNLESHGSEHNHDGSDPIPDLVQLRDDFDEYKNEIRSLGLGIDVDPRATENLDLEVQPGWVVTTPETIGIPPFRGHGVVRIDRRNGDRVAQTYYHLSGAMETAFFTRVLGQAGWTDWVRILHSGNTTNIVNQDYEVGTWTPGYAATGLPIQEIEYSSLTSGSYVKIGNLVYIKLDIVTTRVIKGNASGYLRITGLPFPGGGPGFAGLSIARATYFSSGANERYPYWRASVSQYSTDINIYSNNPDYAAETVSISTLRDHTSGSNNSIAISGFYYTTEV